MAEKLCSFTVEGFYYDLNRTFAVPNRVETFRREIEQQNLNIKLEAKFTSRYIITS